MPKDFEFNPSSGLRDTNTYIDNPANPRNDIQELLDQLGEHMNTELKPLFASGTLAASGNFEIPISLTQKLVIKWGTSKTGASATLSSGVYTAQTPAVTFPTPFPNSCIYADAITSQTGSAWRTAIVKNASTATFYFAGMNGTEPINRDLFWFAIGY